jgi:hypothetical protein
MKLSQILPGNVCEILSSYLGNHKFAVHYEGAVSYEYSIEAGVPQGSVLGPLLYVLFTADLPTSKGITNATLADDTALISVSEQQKEAIEKLQKAVNRVFGWAKRWRIKLNESK